MAAVSIWYTQHQEPCCHENTIQVAPCRANAGPLSAGGLPLFMLICRSADFFHKGLEGKYSRLCGSYDLCCNYSTLPCSPQTAGDNMSLNSRAVLQGELPCKPDGRLPLAPGSSLPISDLKETNCSLEFGTFRFQEASASEKTSPRSPSVSASVIFRASGPRQHVLRFLCGSVTKLPQLLQAGVQFRGP